MPYGSFWRALVRLAFSTTCPGCRFILGIVFLFHPLLGLVGLGGAVSHLRTDPSE